MKILGIMGVCVALLVVAPACDKDKKKAQESERQSPEQKKKSAEKLVAPDILKHIPADAIFVFANYERVDDAFVSRVSKYSAIAIESYKSDLAEDSPEKLEEFNKYSHVLTAAGLKKIGVHTSPFFAMYNHGLAFVARVELADGTALQAFVDKLVAEHGESETKIQSNEAGTMRYVEFREDDSLFVIGIGKKQLVFAAMPAPFKNETMPYIVGDKMPAKSIVTGGALKKVVSTHGGAKGVGFFDIEGAVKLLMSGDAGLKGTDFDLTSLSSDCQQEYMGLARLMPRLVFGLGRLDKGGISAFSGVELRKDLASKLAKVASPVPGYSYAEKSDAMAAMGMGFSSRSLLTLLTDAGKKLSASPYQCEQLAPFNGVFAKANEGIDLIPPVINDIVGYILIFDTIDKDTPTNSSGLFALQSEDLGPLLILARNLVPGLKDMKLEVGAAPSKINLEPLGLAADTHIARSEDMVAAAVGKSKSRLSDLLATTTPKKGPFFFLRIQLSGADGLMETVGEKKEISKEKQEIIDKLDSFTYEMEADTTGLIVRMTLKTH